MLSVSAPPIQGSLLQTLQQRRVRIGHRDKVEVDYDAVDGICVTGETDETKVAMPSAHRQQGSV